MPRNKALIQARVSIIIDSKQMLNVFEITKFHRENLALIRKSFDYKLVTRIKETPDSSGFKE